MEGRADSRSELLFIDVTRAPRAILAPANTLTLTSVGGSTESSLAELSITIAVTVIVIHKAFHHGDNWENVEDVRAS